MRTTVTLKDDALVTAQAYARARALTLEQAMSELIVRRRGERLPTRKSAGFWVFDIPPSAPRITARQVKSLLENAT
jgi:hypothetical protein